MRRLCRQDSESRGHVLEGYDARLSGGACSVRKNGFPQKQEAGDEEKTRENAVIPIPV